jgi:hypothetical protein
MAKKALEWLELERTKRRIGVCRGWLGTWKRRREGGLVQHSAKAGERWGGVRPTVGPRRGDAGSSSVGAGERREHGGALVWEDGQWAGPGNKKKEKEMGPTQGNSATF